MGGSRNSGETPCLVDVGVYLWEMNDECQSADGDVSKRARRLNALRGLNEFASAL